MKVILLRDIAKLGKRNDVVEVSQGYAMNVLVAKGEAKIATDAVLNQIKQEEKHKAYKKEVAQSAFLKLIEKLRTTPIAISGKRHQEGSLFAHISEEDIAQAIYVSTGISINPKQVQIQNPIKHHGTYQIILEEGGKKEEVTLIVKN